MKKNILNLSAIALIATASIFTGCNKDDIAAPVVTLTGDVVMTISLNSTTFTDPGATATDEEDGAITPVPSGSVNKNLAGTYILTYTATDAAGNVGTATRTVIVRNDAAIYAGTYTCTNPGFGTDSPYQQTVTASTTTNNHIVFSKFAFFTGNNAIEAVFTGGTYFVLIPALSVTISGCQFTFTPNGNGNPITTNGGKYSFSIKYKQEDLLGGVGCTAIAATPYEDTCVQN